MPEKDQKTLFNFDPPEEPVVPGRKKPWNDKKCHVKRCRGEVIITHREKEIAFCEQHWEEYCLKQHQKKEGEK